MFQQQLEHLFRVAVGNGDLFAGIASISISSR
jgi:hypothetical protein